ncbi:hypothetical protein [Hoylesella timonensis]|uniref:hypothetical protein n=1 Tax=Hoylesella timonensis TaxID=386414 RepID=UPI00336AC6DA
MKKKVFRKNLYEAPQCKILLVQNEHFFCTSVVPKVPGSIEEEWQPDEDKDGGEFEL